MSPADWIAGRRLWPWVALGLALRLSYALPIHLRGLNEPANDGYTTIAVNLVERSEYSFRPGIPTAAREPGYILLIAALYKLVGERPFAVVLLHVALNLATCLLILRLGRRAFGPQTGAIAFLIALAYPYFFFYCAQFYRETFLTFLVVAALDQLDLLVREARPRQAALAGLAAGAAAASLSTYIAIGAALGLWVGWLALFRLRRPLLAAAFGITLVAPPVAWTARNYRVFHRFIPGSTIGGFNLLTVLVVPPEVRGTPQEPAVASADPEWRRILDMGDLMTDDGSQQEAFFRAAFARIRRAPGRYAALAVKQLGKLWRLYPYPRKYQHSYAVIQAVSLLSDGWLIPLGLLGLWRFRRRLIAPNLAVLLGSASLLYALLAAVVRYRLPLMPALILTASALLAERLAGEPLKSEAGA